MILAALALAAATPAPAAAAAPPVTLDVLIYNVEGLPWPARRNRAPYLRRIAELLAADRAAGHAPDIVLLQEAFAADARAIGRRAGYPYRVAGPRRADRAAPGTAARLPPGFRADRRRLKGERFGKLLSSGLYALSEYPIVASAAHAFSRRACAGFDCLANKGVMLVRVAVPGLPAPVDIVATHLNSRRASGVSRDRSGTAHRAQTEEMQAFVARTRLPADALIWGGDFNARHDVERFADVRAALPGNLVHRWCFRNAACDVRMSWDGDAPWLDTQDLQGFDPGTAVTLAPVRVEAMFDRPEHGARLSDHDGFRVSYRLSAR